MIRLIGMVWKNTREAIQINAIMKVIAFSILSISQANLLLKLILVPFDSFQDLQLVQIIKNIGSTIFAPLRLY